MLGESKCAGRVFNMGSDQPIRIRALAELVCKTLNSRSPIEHVPYEQAFGAGFDDLRERRPDLTRLRSVIDFHPAIPLEQTIRDLAAFMSEEGPGHSAIKGLSGQGSNATRDGQRAQVPRDALMPRPSMPANRETRV
jgi:UDP-glucose 4-epimerase